MRNFKKVKVPHFGEHFIFPKIHAVKTIGVYLDLATIDEILANIENDDCENFLYRSKPAQKVQDVIRIPQI